jgi:hypothetical protein
LAAALPPLVRTIFDRTWNALEIQQGQEPFVQTERDNLGTAAAFLCQDQRVKNRHSAQRGPLQWSPRQYAMNPKKKAVSDRPCVKETPCGPGSPKSAVDLCHFQRLPGDAGERGVSRSEIVDGDAQASFLLRPCEVRISINHADADG